MTGAPDRLLRRLEWHVVRRLDGRLQGAYRTVFRGNGIDFTGLGKIAALGIKVSRGCAYHGVAFNVAMDLEPFSRINPCGYANLETVDLSTIGVSTTWEDAARVLADKLVTHLAP